MSADAYARRVRTQVLNVFDPALEGWAAERVQALTTRTGAELEALLDRLKDMELADAASETELEEVLNDDLPGVRYYLELVDEAGDLVNNLNEYLRGEAGARENFMRDTQKFEQFLAALTPLEREPDDISHLAEVSALYRTLRDGSIEVFQRYDPSTRQSAVRAIAAMEESVYNVLQRRLDGMASAARTASDESLSGLRARTHAKREHNHDGGARGGLRDRHRAHAARAAAHLAATAAHDREHEISRRWRH